MHFIPSVALAAAFLSQLSSALPRDTPPPPPPQYNPLKVVLAQGEGSAIVKATLENVGHEDLHLYKETNMLTDSPTDKVDVTDKSGKDMPFIGLNVHRYMHDLHASDFLTLAPGKSISKEVDVAKLYDITEAGQYYVIATGNIAVASDKDMASNSTTISPARRIDYTSNKLEIHIDATGVKNSKRHTANALKKRSAMQSDCSGQRGSIVAAAMQNCANLANMASSAAQSGDQTFQAFFKTTNGRVRQQVSGRLSAIAQECSAGPRGGKTRMHCTEYSSPFQGQCSGNVIAYTTGKGSTRSPDVYLCDYFFNQIPATPSQCASNDQGMTILHELAHNDVVYEPGCADRGYGIMGVLGMDTRTALDNSDSFGFYSTWVALGCRNNGYGGEATRRYGSGSGNTRQPTNPGGNRQPPKTGGNTRQPTNGGKRICYDYVNGRWVQQRQGNRASYSICYVNVGGQWRSTGVQTAGGAKRKTYYYYYN